ncbi:MAG: hypothetical protein NTX72_04860 [Candidatus Uhrbacteria bacterium]|nr:hypothetical protein [Candidatus Uhrbacteria bacterium]
MIDKRPPKPKTSARDVRTDLRAIYERADGSIPDMSKLSSRKKSGLHRFLVRGILLLLVLSAVAWTGFFFFSKGFIQKQDQLSVKIDGPQEVKAGDAVTYTIRYENTGDVPMATLELAASLPPDFHLTTSTPEANDKNVWTIGSLTPKSDGMITINGTFLAEVPSTEKLQALFTYKPANFNSSFQTIQTLDVNVNDSVLQMTLNGPDHALPGDQVQYVISVGHAQKDPVQNLRVIPVLPQNFTVSGTDPAFENGQSYWNLASLDPNQPKTFTVKGSYTASATGDQSVGANVGFVSDNVYLKQKDANVTTSMQGGSIAFHLIVNGSNTDQTIDPGKSLHGSIDFTNQAKDTAQDVSFTLALDSTGKLPIDWAHADLHSGKQNGNQIVWDKSSLSSLKQLKPNDSGILDFTLPLSTGSNTSDHFTMTLTSHIGSLGETGGAKSISSTPILISINAQTGFTSEARYFTTEGTPVGTGPLPPTVGKTTTYRVYWNITNALHDLSGVAVTTAIPANVLWTNKSSTDIGTITYKKDIITWIIPKLPTSIPQAGAWFEVSVKPAASDVDTSMPLTTSSTMNAKDASTSQTITKTADALTTNLSTDEFASGKGTVKK